MTKINYTSVNEHFEIFEKVYYVQYFSKYAGKSFNLNRQQNVSTKAF